MNCIIPDGSHWTTSGAKETMAIPKDKLKRWTKYESAAISSAQDTHTHVRTQVERDESRLNNRGEMRFETLLSLANQYGLNEGNATGTVATKEYAGYGRIRVDEIGATIPFHSRDFSGSRIRTGDQVRFTIEAIKYDYHAKEIERASNELSSEA